MSEGHSVYRTADDFDDVFEVVCDVPEQAWAAVVVESGQKTAVILLRPQMEQLFVALGRELGEPGDVITRRRAEREATDAAALRRVVERLEQENRELRKELGRA